MVKTKKQKIDDYYRKKARKIYQAQFGELLPRILVHHKNFNPRDNRIENLQAVTRAEHNKIHAYNVIFSDEIQELYNKGYYDREIGRELEVSYQVVRNWRQIRGLLSNWTIKFKM